MDLLHIFQALTDSDAASVGVPVTVVFAVFFCIFLFGAMKRAQAAQGVWYKQNMAKFLIPIVALWLGALAWIWSDYRPYDPKRDGVPREQTDTTRIPAEDLIKKQQQ